MTPETKAIEDAKLPNKVYALIGLRFEKDGVTHVRLTLVTLVRTLSSPSARIGAGEAIAFKRYPVTIFAVIVYTCILFMVFPMVNVMSTLDRNQIEAGRDLGASTWQLHWRIIVPHAKPGIAVG